jgi:hypothetical protein
MLLELLTLYQRRRRYRRLSEIIAPVITEASQQRVDKTLTDAYSKATAQGASPEDIKNFNQTVINKANEVLAKENALRIRQWTEAILDEEQKTFGL